jgi:hypothetical protein
MAGKGHQERFSPPKLNAACGLTKETFAGLSRNEGDAPIAAIFAARDISRRATDSGHSRDLGGILGSTLN